MVEVGSEKFKSKAITGGHTNPTWGEQQLFNLDGSVDIMHITIWSKHLLGDTANGRCDIPLGTLVLTDQPQWLTIVEKNNYNKTCGSTFIPPTSDTSGCQFSFDLICSVCLLYRQQNCWSQRHSKVAVVQRPKNGYRQQQPWYIRQLRSW